MEQKIIFREILSDIKKAADASDNCISKEEIAGMLQSLPLSEEHLKLVYEYLASQNIRVVDSISEKEELPEEKERRSLSLYLEELEELGELEEENEQVLFAKIKQGDQAAKDRLICSYLPLICEMAKECDDTLIPSEDLIQEGNLGLLMALASLEEFDSPAACRAHILNEINRSMEEAIEESRQNQKGGNGIVSRVNHLNEAVMNLERDLEHKVSPNELSAYLEMPLEEILEVLRMAGDQIEVEQE